MTRDDLAPLAVDDPGLPCERCGGSGIVTHTLRGEPFPMTCGLCGGSGYGTPENSPDYNLRRLIAWARRSPMEG